MTMETVAPCREIMEVIKENGGDAFKLCYQCGLCDAVCPWNRVRTFSMRKIIRQAVFGLTEIEVEDIGPSQKFPEIQDQFFINCFFIREKSIFHDTDQYHESNTRHDG